MKNKKLNEWKFDFGLCATKANQMIPNSQCEELLGLIIEWAEEKELGVGGGYREFPPEKPVDLVSLLDAIDQLWKVFNHCKANFPGVSDEMKDAQVLGTPDFYLSQGYDNILHQYPAPLTEDKIKHINQAGHWLNQNALIRLYAVLDSHGAMQMMDSDIEEAKYVELIRHLRNSFAHGSGIYNPAKKKHRKTMQIMGEVLNISTEGITWPLAIDTVLQPLFEGCKRYVERRFGTT